MPTGYELALFLAAGFLLNLSPGADMLYIVSKGSTYGSKAGMVAALGIGGGCLVHIAFSVVGLWAIIQTSPQAFTVLKYLGAAYLVYLGLALIFGKQSRVDRKAGNGARTSLWRVFWQGVLVNVLNPKIAVFFLAFLPQFIDAGSTHKTVVFIILGLIFNTVGTAWNIFIGWAAALVKEKVLSGRGAGRWLKTTVGGLFVLLAVRLALAEQG